MLFSLILAASSMVPNCVAVGEDVPESMQATASVISADDLGGTDVNEPNAASPAYRVGPFIYRGQGVRVQSSDPRLAAIRLDQSTLVLDYCGFDVSGVSPWDRPAEATAVTLIFTRRQRAPSPAPGAVMAEQQGAAPRLQGFTGQASWPIGYGHAQQHFLGLMHPDDIPNQTVIVLFRGVGAEARTRELARIPMRLETISALPAIHSNGYYVTVMGRDADGALVSVVLGTDTAGITQMIAEMSE